VSEQRASRIEAARQRAANVKLALGVSAVVGFLAALGFAYASHPGSASTGGVAAGGSDGGDAFVEPNEGAGAARGPRPDERASWPHLVQVLVARALRQLRSLDYSLSATA
jgi:hypothetical protein